MDHPLRDEQKEPLWLNGAALHPTLPLLATTSAPVDEESGRVTMWDVSRGVPLFHIDTDRYVGPFEPTSRAVVRWADEGLRLATPCDTNGVMLLQDGRVFGAFYPDDGRDHNVEYCWVNTSLYSPACGGTIVDLAEGDELFDRDLIFLEHEADSYELSHVEWSKDLQAIVGITPKNIKAFDPIRSKTIYDIPLVSNTRYNIISSDGRWLLHAHSSQTPRLYYTLSVYDLSAHTQLVSTLEVMDVWDAHWGPDGWLCVLRGYRNHTPSFMLLQHGKLVHTLPISRTHASHRVNGAYSFAFSPDAMHLALLDGQHISIYDIHTSPARLVRTLPLPPPSAPPAHPDWMHISPEDIGIVWAAHDRIFVLGTYFICVLSTSGERVMHTP